MKIFLSFYKLFQEWWGSSACLQSAKWILLFWRRVPAGRPPWPAADFWRPPSGDSSGCRSSSLANVKPWPTGSAPVQHNNTLRLLGEKYRKAKVCRGVGSRLWSVTKSSRTMEWTNQQVKHLSKATSSTNCPEVNLPWTWPWNLFFISYRPCTFPDRFWYEATKAARHHHHLASCTSTNCPDVATRRLDSLYWDNPASSSATRDRRPQLANCRWRFADWPFWPWSEWLFTWKVID